MTNIRPLRLGAARLSLAMPDTESLRPSPATSVLPKRGNSLCAGLTFLFALLLLVCCDTRAGAQTPSAKSWDSAIIEDIAADQSSLRARDEGNGGTLSFAVESEEIKAAIKSFAEGDKVALNFDEEPSQDDQPSRNVLKNISIRSYRVPERDRAIALIVAGILFSVISIILLQNRARSLVIGADNRYSNSKFQTVVWFFVLIVTYVTVIWFRWWAGGFRFAGGVNIPQNLLLLSGLSAITFAAAKGITQSNIASGTVVKTSAQHPSFPSDLFNDDSGNVDMGDFQMVIITLLAVLVYLARIFGFLGIIELHSSVTLPDVDTTILATFGLGQGAYLAKKYVGDVKPPPSGGGKQSPVRKHAKSVGPSGEGSAEPVASKSLPAVDEDQNAPTSKPEAGNPAANEA